jgi:molecular chaperone DnaK (HSP70)
MDDGAKGSGAVIERSSRYLIGVDLGTTNSVVAYIDTQEVPVEGSSGLHVFEVPQLLGPGELRPLPHLPSFLYFPTEAEIASGTLALPWEERPSSIAGVMAREQGALLPGRQVSSAKSWLCQGAVDRTADILPIEAEPSAPRVSPVEASARYLMHLRNAWNHAMAADEASSPEQLFEKQKIVLTVPASFDEEARELTVEGARRAGLENLTLLEEPLATFYAWIAEHQHAIRDQVQDGDLVLICDIGGGTSDFSLVRARSRGEEIEFERTAIGDHLLLGGENLDLALAHHVEQKLNAKLSFRQRRGLQIACSVAKERLLTEPSIDRLPISILGSGRAVVGQMLTSELTRDEVIEVLTNGFLPLTAPDELPTRGRPSGLREIGLPYEGDPAITKHLAAFLRQAALAMSPGARALSPPGDHPEMAMPDAVLFNGGFCVPEIARERIIETISRWFGQKDHGSRPRVLRNDAMSSAVAAGAAYYGGVRRGTGLRVKAGSARSYYIGMRSESGGKAVCVLPAGTDEGTTLPLAGREFSVLANRPVSFTLYSSTVRHDAHGDLADLDLGDMHRHAPLVTLLRYGKKLQELELVVRLAVSFTEVGTLELWCESVTSPHRWRLQFELRGKDAPQTGDSEPPRTLKTTQLASSHVPEQVLESATQLMQTAFAKAPDGAATDPASLVSELESAIGIRKESWSITILRLLADALFEVADGRTLGPRHEVRWLNLFGYCLRPGFGDAQDSRRINQARKIYQAGMTFPGNLQSQVDWLVLWRRVAGGLSAAQQHELRNYLAELGIGRKKQSARLNSQPERQGWRLLSSLEHLSGATRAALGSELLRKLKKEPADGSWLWSLGRFGARIPLYGSLNCVIPAETAADWITALLDLHELTHETASAILQLARRTDDRTRDVSDEVREFAIARLAETGFADEMLIQRLKNFVSPDRDDVARTYGEPLPKGLHLESTANCLSPVSALGAEPRKLT